MKVKDLKFVPKIPLGQVVYPDDDINIEFDVYIGAGTTRIGVILMDDSEYEYVAGINVGVCYKLKWLGHYKTLNSAKIAIIKYLNKKEKEQDIHKQRSCYEL